MLEKMGWDGGGLGRDKTGIQEPIQVQQRAKQAGLGAVGSNNIQVQNYLAFGILQTFIYDILKNIFTAPIPSL